MARARKERARDYWNTGRPFQAGKMIYEQLSKEDRPVWAGNSLDLCRHRFPRVGEVDQVYFVACDPTHWLRAQQSFEAVRALAVGGDSPFSGANLLFRLAEDTAKVIYNASGGPAPYDHNAGWRLVEDLHAICEFLDDPEFTKEAAEAALRENRDPDWYRD